MKVRELVEGLFARFPACDAEPWDHVGLSVGDPDAEAGRILVTLDATFPCVRGALDAGADVIVSHHPVYIKAPDLFAPAPGKAVSQASAAVYAAARNGVSIVSMHTNLDRSVAARTELARLIGMSVSGSLEHPDDPDMAGLGAVGTVPEASLEGFARVCSDAFATVPTVWGDPARRVARVAVCSGSLGDLGDLAIAAGVDAVVAGEAGYHVCQDLAERGCSVVLLGHDASELPYRAVLASALADMGVPDTDIVISDERRMWWSLEEGNRR